MPEEMPLSYLEEKSQRMIGLLAAARGRWEGFAPTDSAILRDVRVMAESILAELDKWEVDPQGIYDPEPVVNPCVICGTTTQNTGPVAEYAEGWQHVSCRVSRVRLTGDPAAPLAWDGEEVTR